MPATTIVLGHEDQTMKFKTQVEIDNHLHACAITK